MNEINIYDLFVDTLCSISHPCDVYGGGVTEGGSAVEGGVRVEECILLCWSLNTGRICVACGRGRRIKGGRRREEILSKPSSCKPDPTNPSADCFQYHAWGRNGLVMLGRFCLQCSNCRVDNLIGYGHMT